MLKWEAGRSGKHSSYITRGGAKVIIETISIKKINPAPYNPRKDLRPGDEEYEKLKRSMQEFGYVEPLVWNKRTGNLSFIKHVDDVKLDIKDLDEQLALDDIDEYSIKTIKQSKEKTLILIRYIQKMMKVYKFMCEESNNPEDLRRYQIIHDLYISEEKLTAKEIAQRHFVHPRTIYKDVDKACETLSVLVFGVDGIKLS